MNTATRPFLRMICGLLLCSILSNALADDGRAYLGGPSLSVINKGQELENAT